MAKDTISKTLIVATLLCVCCSVVVSTAAVVLKGPQEENKRLDEKRNILKVTGIVGPNETVSRERADALFAERIRPLVIDLATGDVTDIDPTGYEQRAAAKDPAESVQIPEDRDDARIKHRAKYAKVYVVRKSGSTEVEQVVLPFHGKGLWSTMYGFIALAPDTNRIIGLRFYEHGETPGLGGEVDNPGWQKLWRTGKAAFYDPSDATAPSDAFNSVKIGVIKGQVDTSNKDAWREIDGLAGATITSRGITNMLHYWLGTDAFGPFLAKIRKGSLKGSGG